jgi:hypothetical protein
LRGLPLPRSPPPDLAELRDQVRIGARPRKAAAAAAAAAASHADAVAFPVPRETPRALSSAAILRHADERDVGGRGSDRGIVAVFQERRWPGLGPNLAAARLDSRSAVPSVRARANQIEPRKPFSRCIALRLFSKAPQAFCSPLGLR